MDNELISVIVPVYNTEKYLRRCLNSIINQTYKNIEIICINDCSTDESLEILNEYSCKDTRIRIFTNKTNIGLAATRNRGIRLTNGSLISFVDSDDTIDLSMYSKLIAKHRESKACIILYNYTRPNAKTKATQYKTSYSKEELFKYTISRKLSSAAWNKLYRKDFIIENNLFFEKDRIYEDSLLAYKVIYYAKKIAIIEEPLYFYYDYEGTLSRNLTKKSFNDIEYAILECKDFLIQNNIFDKYKSYQENRATNFCSYILYKITLLNTTDNIKYGLLEKLWSLIFKHIYINEKNKLSLKVMLYNSYMNLVNSEDLVAKLSNSFKNYKFLSNIVDLINTDLGLSQSIIYSLKEKNIEKVYLYGAGDIAKKLIPKIEKLGIEILGIVDSNTINEDSLLGYRVNRLEYIDFQSNTIVVASESSAYEITKFLENQNRDFEIINFYS